MRSLPSRAASGAGAVMRDLKWSPAEKAIARKGLRSGAWSGVRGGHPGNQKQGCEDSRAVRPLGAGTVPHSAPPGDRPQVRFSPSSTHRTFWPGELAQNRTFEAVQRGVLATPGIANDL